MNVPIRGLKNRNGNDCFYNTALQAIMGVTDYLAPLLMELPSILTRANKEENSLNKLLNTYHKNFQDQVMEKRVTSMR